MMKKSLIAVLFALVLAATGCSTSSPVPGPLSGGGGPNFDQEPLTIVAATELKDLEPLVVEAAAELGFPIELEFPAGTLANSQSLKAGEFDGEKDATWFATNRYVDLIGASDKLANETVIATSPVAFGMWDEAAERLGWKDYQPKWSEFGEAAAKKEFSFGMTDPNSSNSGFSALLSVATALADTGQALSSDDIDRIEDPLGQLFQAQEMVSGSSGWLADTFVTNPGEVDAIINYESTLHQLRDEGHPITVIVPADGVVSADYPLSTLAHPKSDQAGMKVDALVEWLLEHQQEMADTYRRPVTEVDNLPAPVRDQLAIELAFPAQYEVVESLLHTYNHSLRTPGSTTFVLDTSGSMEGERLNSLKKIMNSLIDGSASTETSNVGLRTNEQVSLQAFSTEPYPPVTVVFDENDPQPKQELSTYVDNLVGLGDTALYQALLQALEEADTEHGIPSIVLLSDGLVTKGPDYQGFVEAYGQLPDDKKDIPVFVILYGEASEEEMNNIAELTGGAVFDALNGDLDEAFKEIRGFQ